MMHEQIDIFEAAAPSLRPILQRSGDLPEDFTIVPDFLTKAEERDLLRSIDAEPWNWDLKRRVQQYGFRYDYKARAVSARDRLGDLPDWALELANRLVDCAYFSTVPDQVIVNEYEPGQGISPHTDRTTCFGPEIASLSLNSDIVMDFVDTMGKSGSVLLPRRSMLVLRGASRAIWRHGIAQRRRDVVNTGTFDRKRRVSLTFRSVVIVD
jgi:alkylated DNA repair dioxygenase AlkB